MNEKTSTTTQNWDPAEVAKFDQLARTWWDEDGDFKPLHAINPLRLGYIQEHVELTGKAVLDVGCGGGILRESLARAGATVTGIDLAEKPLQVARLHRL
ncbi:bifunctional 2-polyprenyl-6-hydroxyphenol methylase/3-demethylubiquinol 3-O-methyltransferase UbiG, partial [Pseudomonadales bacterium]|nr:bifunctional 2-polyprenyl-6-hydroxyphenol methylase/3-demethylubiquinol 3-O-methyltransferase UbiG [Pseudomonadales bacterium]